MGFFDVLKDVGRAVAPIAQKGLGIASPLLGPIGIPVSTVAGAAIGALNKAVSESSFTDAIQVANTTTLTKPAALERGTTQRAVLAEAALQTVLRMDLDPTAEALIDSMRQKYEESGFSTAQADEIGKQMVPLLSQARHRLESSEELLNEEMSSLAATSSLHKDGESDIKTGDEGVDGLVNLVHSVPVGELKIAEPDSLFLTAIGALVLAGGLSVKPLMDSRRRGAWSKNVDDMSAEKTTGKEKESIEETRDVVANEKAAALLVHRAVLAECALQAVVEANKEALQQSVILCDGVQMEAWGFFDSMKKVVQAIGPVVLKAAPAVLKA